MAEHLFKTYQLPMRLETDDVNYPYEYAYNSTFFISNCTLEEELENHELVELPCHVGFVDHDIMQISSLNMQRMEDSYLVNSTEFKKSYQNLGYKLIGFQELNKKNTL